jgi:zinc protease
MARTITLFLALVLLAITIPPRSARADSVRVEVPFETYRLANGLQVVLHKDPRTPIVTVNVWYHVGSKDEPPGKNGFAHLFEHVMFQGSRHVPEDTFFRYLQSAGASDVNGTTNYDRTNYFETLPANRLELALWLESDRMAFLLDHVDNLTFTGQREVVLNERRQNYENAPYGLVPQFLAAALFPEGHPYHRLTIGSPDDLARATLDDVKAFFRAWYVPNNATLVVAGDFDPAQAKALVEQYFGPIPGHPIPARAAPPPVSLAGETRLDVEAGVELPRVYVAWPTPAVFAPGDGELDLLARVLSGGKTSRLYKRLVYDARIAKDVAAFQASQQLGSTFEIYATALPGHTAAELLQAIDEELARLRAEGVQGAELARAQTSYLSSAVFAAERDSSRADMLNRYNQFTGDPGYLAKDLARYENATAESVRDAARAWLPEGKRVVALVQPTKGAPLSGRLAGKGAP